MATAVAYQHSISRLLKLIVARRSAVIVLGRKPGTPGGGSFANEGAMLKYHNNATDEMKPDDSSQTNGNCSGSSRSHQQLAFGKLALNAQFLCLDSIGLVLFHLMSLLPLEFCAVPPMFSWCSLLLSPTGCLRTSKNAHPQSMGNAPSNPWDQLCFCGILLCRMDVECLNALSSDIVTFVWHFMSL